MSDRIRRIGLPVLLLGIASGASTASAVTVVNGDFNTQTALGGSSAFDGELDERAFTQFTDFNGDSFVLQENGTMPFDGSNGAVAAGSRPVNVPGFATVGHTAQGLADYLPSEADPGNVQDDYGYAGPGNGLFQNIGNSLAGATYTLSAKVAGFVPNTTETFRLELYEGIDDPGSGGGPSGASGPGDAATGVLLTSVQGTRDPNGLFITSVTPESSGAVGGQPLQIRLLNIGGIQALFDDVVVTETPVPEPASLSLLGLAGLATLRRRRRA